MNKSIAVALACLLAAVTAHADDMMKKDPMPMEPKMEPKMERKDAMKKKPMKQEGMKQEAMKHEAMKPQAMQDGAAMDAMPHDDMRKEMPAQPAATNH
ncbi:pentapeptide MXKDX repeat protein [Pseudoduganella flava]|uniref:Pentapeptide MXKDX repeat protein n=1 Tax=Pseudoduganella flava TaxID=871742 RepID=A0A562PCJ2_9BURK|nr:hypothetical protein [Pseudoduganella flava]TWI42134.1 pentapeptide MXKDX repeat protein [Pseudoduganella flava]